MSEYQLPIVETLQVMTAAPPPIPYGVKMIGAELEWPETQGGGVKVCVVDTGAPQHPDIKLAGYADFTGEGPEDRRGHAIHVCGILAADGKIKGVAPKVELFTAKVFRQTGGAQRDWIVRALDWARTNGMNVVNMSLGGPSPDAEVEKACRRCYDAGILLVTSAGNFGLDFPRMYPAEYDTCLSVSAVDVEKQHADFSSRGEGVELAAAGVEVYSTWLNGLYALQCGTSMASPHIAGAAAIMIAKYRLRFGKDPAPGELRTMMAIYAEDLGPRGRDRKYGFGVFSFGRITDGQPAPDRPAIDLRFKVGQDRYWKNGQERKAHIAPVIINERTMVGLRDVGEALDCKVDWIPPDEVVIKG